MATYASIKYKIGTQITGEIATAAIADNAVTTAKINADAVTDAKIADDVVGTEHLTAGEVDTTALGADAVTAAKIADDVVNSEHLAAGGIDNEHIADDAIDSEHYADGSIDLAHMSSQSVDEDNLYISNSGSNDQFLQKQSGNSGGLTWASAGSETSAGAVGTYCQVYYDIGSNATYSLGSDISGGSFAGPAGHLSAGAGSSTSGAQGFVEASGSLSGTWRLMGYMKRQSTGQPPYYEKQWGFSIALRIS